MSFLFDPFVGTFTPTGASGGGGGGTPGGPNAAVQFNNSGAFGGSASFEWDGQDAIVQSLTSLPVAGVVSPFVSVSLGTPPSSLWAAGSVLATTDGGLIASSKLPHMTIYGTQSGGSGSVNLVGSRGTNAAPSGTLNTDTLGEYLVWGYNSADAAFRNGFSFYVNAVQDFSAAGHNNTSPQWFTWDGPLFTANETGALEVKVYNQLQVGKTIRMSGATSGTVTFAIPAIAGTNTITWPAGTTDFSSTGGTSQVVKQTSAGGAFTVAQVTAADIGSGAALTRVNDTNVTLTLGGTPASALLAATSITAGWSGTLGLTRGGTALDTSGVTDGQLLIGQSSDHTFGLATISAGSNISVTNAGHSITIAATGLPTSANPTQNVDLSTHNGVATTFMRSDAAPALSQSIAPTWTGAHTWQAISTFAPSSAGLGNAVTITGNTETTNTNIPLSITQTWNAGGVTFTGIKANFTSSASASGSLLMDLQLGSTSEFNVRKDGLVTIPINGNIGYAITVSGQNPVGFGRNSTVGGMSLFGGANSSPSDGNADALILNAVGILCSGTNFIGFTNGAVTQTFDVKLARDAAQTLALRNGTNAQDFSIYNTFTSSTSFERLMLDWITTANVAMIYTQKGSGGGTARVLQLNYGGTTTSAISIPITSGTVTFGGSTLVQNVAIPAGGTAGAGYMFSSTSNFGIFPGSGPPTLSAAKGSIYVRSDGTTTNNRAYINTDGGTTWTAITTAA